MGKRKGEKNLSCVLSPTEDKRNFFFLPSLPKWKKLEKRKKKFSILFSLSFSSFSPTQGWFQLTFGRRRRRSRRESSPITTKLGYSCTFKGYADSAFLLLLLSISPPWIIRHHLSWPLLTVQVWLYRLSPGQTLSRTHDQGSMFPSLDTMHFT